MHKVYPQSLRVFGLDDLGDLHVSASSDSLPPGQFTQVTKGYCAEDALQSALRRIKELEIRTVPAPTPIHDIRELRNITGCGLREGRDIVMFILQCSNAAPNSQITPSDAAKAINGIVKWKVNNILQELQNKL